MDQRHRKRDFTQLSRHIQWGKAFSKATGIARNGGIAVLLGDRGTGKTQAAVEIIRNTCKDLRSTLYLRSREVGMLLREAYDKNATVTEVGVMDRLVRPYLLVLDECQERADKDWEIRSITLIIDKRHGALRPTILIANCTNQQFVRLMGSSVTDRVKEMGGVIEFNWKSFRG